MLKVLIVDDLKSARDMIRDMLTADPEIHVCGTAERGEEAIELVRAHQPQLIILDSDLRGTSGYDVAERIMKARPTPIVMLTASTDSPVEVPARAFGTGVLEVIKKDDLYRWRTRPYVAAQFIRKIKLMSKVTHYSVKKHRETPKSQKILPGSLDRSVVTSQRKKDGSKVIAIVSSTGGPNALFKILRALSSDFPVPILIVQHMSPGFVHGLAEWLHHDDHVHVHVAEDDETLRPAEVLLAPDDAHLTVTGNARVRLEHTPPVGGHRPSGDALLESVSVHYGEQALGIILTGMGHDGAKGMAALKRGGGTTIAQDKATSIIFGMPKTAIDLGVVDYVLPLEEIASAMKRFLAGRL